MPGEGAAHDPVTRVPRLVDLRTALLLSAAYGLTGGVAAVLLIPLIAAKTEVNLPLPPAAFAAVLAVQLTLIYGAFAWFGLRLARQCSLDPAPLLTRWWQRSPAAPSRSAWLSPILIGLASGTALVAAVRLIIALFPGTLPASLHPPSFASALAASTACSIGEEILCRLFILSLALRLMPRGGPAARAAAIAISALAFAALHTPGMIFLYGGIEQTPPLAWVWVIGLNSLVGTAFGTQFLRHGIGAAILAHWCCDLVWHVGSVLT